MVIQLTGANRHTGASTTADNLALVLAWDLVDHRILLVDGNLADPSAHRPLACRWNRACSIT